MTIHTCQQCATEFRVDEQELAFYKKIDVPIPQWCPACREQRRLLFRNLRNLYQRKCDFSGRDIISSYAPDSKLTVYHSDIWWSDKWDGMDYGRDFDFSRPFFEQFAELYQAVPVIHQYGINLENCEYINGAANCKSCYLSFNMDYCEECYYISDASNCTSCIDGMGLVKCELCYECIDCNNCYNLLYSERCRNCYDSYFLYNCQGTKNSIGCVNLVNKEYYIFNEPVTPEAFTEYKATLSDPAKLEIVRQRTLELRAQLPAKHYVGYSNEEFSGDNIHHLKNSYNCFDAYELENCRYCNYVFKAKDCMDFNIFGDNSELIYNCLATGINCTSNMCCMYCWSGSSDNYYCHLISGTKNSFGCSGLKNKQYCILNKQYTKEEYETLLPKIIAHMKETGEWGQFFPPELSPFAYNESVAPEMYPLNQAEVEQRGWKWRPPKQSVVVPGLPTCGVCKKSYKILPQEQAMYDRNNLPQPINCPECRHQARLQRRNPRNLWKRQCMCTQSSHGHSGTCLTEFQTSYAPDASEHVYCEDCYRKEIY